MLKCLSKLGWPSWSLREARRRGLEPLNSVDHQRVKFMIELRSFICSLAWHVERARALAATM